MRKFKSGDHIQCNPKRLARYARKRRGERIFNPSRVEWKCDLTKTLSLEQPSRRCLQLENISIISINSLYQNIIIYTGEAYAYTHRHENFFRWLAFIVSENEKTTEKRSEKSFKIYFLILDHARSEDGEFRPHPWPEYFRQVESEFSAVEYKEAVYNISNYLIYFHM